MDLLESDVPLGAGKNKRTVRWLRETLEGDATAVDHPGGLDPLRIGVPDHAAETRMALKAGLSHRALIQKVGRLFDGAEPSFVRDALAEIDSTTQPRAAQAKRGRATRRLLHALESGKADPSDIELVRALHEAQTAYAQERRSDDGNC